MPQQLKNRRERAEAEYAAKLLQASWDLGEDRESPDFVVTDGTHQFGLELTSLFSDPVDSRDSGAPSRHKEKRNQARIDACRKTFEAKANIEIPLIVKFRGNIDDNNMVDVVPRLLEMGLQDWEPTCRSKFVIKNADPALHIYVTRALSPHWFYVDDRVGWVTKNPEERISRAIKEKAKKLPSYRKGSGIEEMHLLLVANRTMNSGRLVLANKATFDFCGFQAVYFLSYPEEITVLKSRM